MSEKWTGRGRVSHSAGIAFNFGEEAIMTGLPGTTALTVFLDWIFLGSFPSMRSEVHHNRHAILTIYAFIDCEIS